MTINVFHQVVHGAVNPLIQGMALPLLKLVINMDPQEKSVGQILSFVVMVSTIINVNQKDIQEIIKVGIF